MSLAFVIDTFLFLQFINSWACSACISR